MTSKGKRSVRPRFSKGRKPAFRSTEPQGAASSIRFFIGGFNDGTTAKKSLAGYIPFDGAKCGFLDLPYDPRVRGTKAVEPKMRKPKAVEPRKNTNPPGEFAVPVRFSNDITDAIEAISRCLKLKDRTDGTKAVEPKMRKPKAVEPGQNTNSPHEDTVAVPFELLNLEDDSSDDKL